MQGFRAMMVPVLLFAAFLLLGAVDLQIPAIAHFDFIWDVLLGAVLGAGLAWLPTLAGFKAKRNATTSMFWICGFASLLIIFYQYMSLVTGSAIQALAFLNVPIARLRIVEGAMLGYCSFVAGRGMV